MSSLLALSRRTIPAATSISRRMPANRQVLGLTRHSQRTLLEQQQRRHYLYVPTSWAELQERFTRWAESAEQRTIQVRLLKQGNEQKQQQQQQQQQQQEPQRHRASLQSSRRGRRFVAVNVKECYGYRNRPRWLQRKHWRKSKPYHRSRRLRLFQLGFDTRSNATMDKGKDSINEGDA